MADCEAKESVDMIFQDQFQAAVEHDIYCGIFTNNIFLEARARLP